MKESQAPGRKRRLLRRQSAPPVRRLLVSRLWVGFAFSVVLVLSQFWVVLGNGGSNSLPLFGPRAQGQGFKILCEARFSDVVSRV